MIQRGLQKSITTKLGHTVVEILMVLGILVLVLGATMASIMFSQNQSELHSTADELVQTLRKAQMLTVAGQGNSVFGVHFDVDQYVLFEGAVYDSGALTNLVSSLSDNLRIDQINLNGGGSDVIFSRPQGETDYYGSVRIYLHEISFRVVEINEIGRVTF